MQAATGLVTERSHQVLPRSRPKAHCACARPVCFAANRRDDFATRGALRAHLRQRRSCGCVTGCPGNRRSCRCLVASETQVFVMQLKHLRTLLSPQVRSCVPVPPRPVLTFQEQRGTKAQSCRGPTVCRGPTAGRDSAASMLSRRRDAALTPPCSLHCVSLSIRFVPGPVLGLGGIQNELPLLLPSKGSCACKQRTQTYTELNKRFKCMPPRGSAGVRPVRSDGAERSLIHKRLGTGGGTLKHGEERLGLGVRKPEFKS